MLLKNYYFNGMIRTLILIFKKKLFYILFRTLITENDLELTTPFYVNLNLTNETTNDIIEEIDVSSPVKRVLREIFRTYEPYCWRHSYGRGVGHPINTCPD